MSVDRRLLNWGVFLILLGGVPLAVAQGWIPSDAVARAWELWPLILIGIGIGLILSRTPLRALGGLIVAATFGVILGAVVAVGFGGLDVGGIGCGAADPGAPRIVEQSGSFAGGSGAVRLEADCASVTVGTTNGGTWDVEVRGSDDARPTIEQSGDRIVVRSPEGIVVFPFDSRRSSWDLSLGRDSRLDLEVAVNAGDASLDLDGAALSRLSFDGNAVGDSLLDLSGATVERLDVTVNAADLAILLPAGADTSGTVQGNAASVDLCADPGVGLRLVVEENITASNNYDERGLVQRGNAWETPDFASAVTQVELRTTGSAVSFTLNPEDGCR